MGGGAPWLFPFLSFHFGFKSPTFFLGCGGAAVVEDTVDPGAEIGPSEVSDGVGFPIQSPL